MRDHYQLPWRESQAEDGAGFAPYALFAELPAVKHLALARDEAAQHILLVLIFSAVSLLTSTGSSEDFWADLNPDPRDFLGTLSCTSATCHGRTEPRNARAGLSRQEYQHWLGGDVSYLDGRRHYDPRARLAKTIADPHALAGQRIHEPRFQEVLRRASNLPDGQADPLVYAKCAKCHDPLGLAEKHGSNEQSVVVQGIGCEACHGGARNWIAAHYQQGLSHHELGKLGMIDTKNVFIRARLCASCHVGSADQDMNHDMIAAGHPPLRFELASHQALIERKHWDDAPRRLAEPNYEVQLWAAGRIASADSALSLLEGRAKRATDRQSPWPEFAESNCFACHQSLRPLTADQNVTSATDLARGSPAWQSWNVALLSPLLTPRTFARDELPPPTTLLDKSLSDIRMQMGRTLTPPPDDTARLAAEARVALRKQVRISSTGEIRGADGSTLDVEGVVQVLSLLPTMGSPSWDQLCHELAAVLAAERSLRDGLARESFEQSRQHVADCDRVRERARQIATSLQFKSATFEWPTADTMTLEQLGTEVKSLATELRRISSSTQY
jgi:hypothetical protein